ncbi:MAG: ribosome recycling factor [Chloroflexi bacterium]|nr:ribosome recycling factor [Chloroflexota bacterium]
MLNDLYIDTKTRMKGAVQAFEEDLLVIRTGRAHPALVERLLVEYYGVLTPLRQLASISVPEPRSLLIRPFDPATLNDIAKAILSSDLGLTPNNDGKAIRLNLPPLNEERRSELVRVVGNRTEEARVAVRNVRRDIMRDLKEYEGEDIISEDDLTRAEKEIQNITDDFIDEIEKIGDRKETEIMEV